ncbi:hypothetical protein GGE65_000667 [Skermanella aerolata]|uniref:tubulin-like doman-containing protein n=1 Tax=Skermanella aerolata TaxID=393310 RepID=UPI003D19C7C6
MADTAKSAFNSRLPTLFIGLGGTGVRTLRYMLWLAQNGQDPDLAAMLAAGKLHFVAVDTDWKANRPGLTVPDYVYPRMSSKKSGETDAFRDLPRLPRLVTIQTEDITRAVDSIRQRRSGGRSNGSDAAETADPLSKMSDIDMEASRLWFPQDDTRTGEEIGVGQAHHEGAGQWRPLGRLGLFLESRTIMDELRDGHRRIRDATPHDRPVRAHIVASLSGGSGSGMFWDAAFMLKSIDPGCNVTGCFLMADPFTGSDRAERIELNAYAALKELAGYKNWRQKETFEVRYPIGSQGVGFRREPGGRPVFDLVYVYQSFVPDGDPSTLPDVNSAAVETSCFRLAQNALTQIRTDIRARIDEGANNERSDANAGAGNQEAGFVFCTSAMVPLDLVDTDYLADILEAQFLLDVERRLSGADVPRLTRRDLDALLADVMDADHNEVQNLPVPVDPRLPAPPAPPAAVSRQEAPGDWIVAVNSLQTEAESLKLPKVTTVERMRQALKKLEEEADRLAAPDIKGNEDRKTELARQLFDSHVPQTLREGWREQIATGVWKASDQKPPVAAIPLIEILKDDIEPRWQRIYQWIKRVKDKLADELPLLDEEARRALDTLIERLARLPQGNPLADEMVIAPASLIQMRVALGMLRDPADTHEQSLIGLKAIHGCGPMDIMMKAFATTLGATLDELGQRHSVRNQFGDAFRSYAHTHRHAIMGHFSELIEISNVNQTLRKQRTRQIHDRGYVQLRKVFTDTGGGHADEFAKAMAPLAQVVRRLFEDPTEEDLKATAEALAERCLLVARAEGAREMIEEFSVKITWIDGWTALLETLDRSFREEERKQPDERRPFALKLALAIEEQFCGRGTGLPGTEIRSEELFNRRLLRARIALRAFVGFWAEQEDFVLQRMGGEEGLQAIMRRCRSRVFGKGAVVSSIQQDKLVIAKPVSGRLTGGRTAVRGDRLMQAISFSAQNALNQTPMFCGDSPRPVVYFEQLFRAGAEILDIERYYRRYQELPEERRGRFHITPAAVALPELLDNFPRSQRALWTCSDAAHQDTAIPHGESACPRCLDEYLRGTRPLVAVRRNPENAPFEIPGGAVLGLPAARRRTVPAALQPYFWDGVRPQELERFERLLDHNGLGLAHPERKGGQHLVFPCLPVTVNGASSLAPLYRDGKHFVSSRDGSRFSHSCFHCSFPISPRQLDAIRDGRSVACPRCQRVLRECSYCSHRDGTLFQPLPDHSGPERCPRCTNVMHRHLPDVETASTDGLAEAGFCRNLFGCPAGGRPWSTAAEMHEHEHCESCYDRRHPALLLPWDELRTCVTRCPVCLTLVGLPKDGQIHRFSPAELVTHFLQHDDPEPDQPCVICGTQPSAVLRWMIDTNFFDDAAADLLPHSIPDLTARVPGDYTLPKIDARNGMDLLELIWRHPEDRALFDAVRALPGIVSPRRRFSDLEKDMRRLFIGKGVAPREAVQRLKALAIIEDDIRARIEGRAIALIGHGA